MRLSRQFQACLFYFYFIFLTKRFHAHKNMSQAKINQQNKNKLTLNNKGNNFSHVLKLLSVTCFCAREIFLPKKKINWLKIVLITSLYYTTCVYPYKPTYREFTCTHLFLFVIICENLFFL